MITRAKIITFLCTATSMLLLFTWTSPVVHALGLPPSPWTGARLTDPESEVLAIKADDGYMLLQTLKKSAQQGNASAMTGLTLYYQHIHQYPEAVYWARKGAHAGNPQSESYLGVAYYHGHGVSKNLKKSIAWLEKAARHHESSSAYFLAYLNQHGQGGFPKNIHRAITLYEAAANDGGFSAAQTLSAIYKNGEGVPPNETLANYWAKFTPKDGWSGNDDYQKAYLAFEKYKRDGDPTAHKTERHLELQGNSMSRSFSLACGAIAWILLFLQVRRSWRIPEGSSAIFWGAISLIELSYCIGYFLNVMAHKDSFVMWSNAIFYGGTSIMCGFIAWLSLFHKTKESRISHLPKA